MSFAKISKDFTFLKHNFVTIVCKAIMLGNHGYHF